MPFDRGQVRELRGLLRIPEKIMTTLQFFIQGRPAPGGSKTAFALRGKGGKLILRPGGAPVINMVDAGGEANRIWKKSCALQARAFMRSSTPLLGPIKVELIFYLTRPQSHYRTGKFSHMLRDDAPEYHTQAPDALKYARGTEDSLTGIIYKDDSQTVRLCSEKRWRTHDQPEGCAVRIVVLDTGTLL